MNKPQNIFVVSQHCTEQDLSEICSLSSLDESYITSKKESFISQSNSSFININIARIGLEKLNRIFKIKTRQFKRNSIEAVRIVSCVIKEIRRQSILKKAEEIKNQNLLERSKSQNKIELKKGTLAQRLDKKLVLKQLIGDDDQIKPNTSSKSSTNKNVEQHQFSTQQSSIKKTPQAMYFKKIRENIMSIKSELNEIQKVNKGLQRQNSRLKKAKKQEEMNYLIHRNRSMPSMNLNYQVKQDNTSYYCSCKHSEPYPQYPVYVTVPINNCSCCGSQYVPFVKIPPHHRERLSCGRGY